FGPAGEAWGPIVNDGGLAEANPREKPLHEAPALTTGCECLKTTLIQKTKVARVLGNRHFAQQSDYPIEHRRSLAFKPSLAMPLSAFRVNHVVAFAPLCDELCNEFRWILKVCINYDSSLTANMI